MHIEKSDENFEPSSLQMLVSELNHTGKSQYMGLLFPVPTRLKMESYALVEALTHHAGTSRNKIMNQLIEVGLESVLGQLSEDVRNTILERSYEVQRNALDKNAGQMERGEV